MKIRKMVKKTLAVGMLALMTCTSMNAMAEKQWVFVGDYFDEPNIRVYGEKDICNFWAGHDDERWGSHINQPKIAFTGEVEDYYYAGTPRKWCHMTNHPNGGSSFWPRCDRGTYSHSRPDGCYEFKEPNPVPPIEPNPYLCNMVNTYPYPPGNVACVDELRAPCIWNLPPEFTDNEAIARIRYCMREHEKYHIAIREDMGSFCNDNTKSDNPTYTQYTDPPNRYLGEMLAHEHSMACLEEQKEQCNTKSCYDQVENARQSDEKAIIYYGDLYNKWGKD